MRRKQTFPKHADAYRFFTACASNPTATEVDVAVLSRCLKGGGCLSVSVRAGKTVLVTPYGTMVVPRDSSCPKSAEELLKTLRDSRATEVAKMLVIAALFSTKRKSK
ncbi:hypothetical protein [Common midwife toad virus]|uniref:Uncharacterized protein n=3 Tax=Common midwife toad virus TaxID=540070 RepID=A0A2D0XK12_9VIRU|nr:hypothetical protein D1U33_gp057 [Common midwife toad virus]AIW68548.1 hypothetical protein [common midwife toad virus-NL]ASH97737.1 hypothetical protein [Common midwife toad virus]ASH97869.1 hypothetical protein [Common midwife toad virus]ASH97945.1 hypothetical protein [Common midwife toad virus]ASH98048.1 hypothetical protein [Common midwife toad virus]